MRVCAGMTRRLIVVFLLALALLPTTVSAATTLDLSNDAKTGVTRPGYLDDFRNGYFAGYFVNSSRTGEKGATDLIFRIALDAKNLLITVSVIFLLIQVIIMLLSKGSEEDIKKWRGGIIWTTVAIIIIQSSYSIFSTLYNKDFGRQGESAAVAFTANVLDPLIALMQTLASFVFVAMLFFAFYKIVTANTEESKLKEGRMQVFYAITGFITIKVASALVHATYGRVDDDCAKTGLFVTTTCVLQNPNTSDIVRIGATLINFINGFLALAVVLILVYAGFLLVTGAGKEDNVKKVKHIFIYCGIGLLIIVTSYIIFDFAVLRMLGVKQV